MLLTASLFKQYKD